MKHYKKREQGQGDCASAPGSGQRLSLPACSGLPCVVLSLRTLRSLQATPRTRWPCVVLSFRTQRATLRVFSFALGGLPLFCLSAHIPPSPRHGPAFATLSPHRVVSSTGCCFVLPHTANHSTCLQLRTRWPAVVLSVRTLRAALRVYGAACKPLRCSVIPHTPSKPLQAGSLNHCVTNDPYRRALPSASPHPAAGTADKPHCARYQTSPPNPLLHVGGASQLQPATNEGLWDVGRMLRGLSWCLLDPRTPAAETWAA